MNTQKVRIVPLNIGDLVGGTSHMTPAEFGAYMRLMIWHYTLGVEGMPDDETRLARQAGCTMLAWKQVRGIVMEKFHKSAETGRWLHNRICKELSKMEEASNGQRAKALKRWHTEDAPALPLHPSGNAIQYPVSSIQEKDQERGGATTRTHAREDVPRIAETPGVKPETPKPETQTRPAAPLYRGNGASTLEEFGKASDWKRDEQGKLLIPDTWLTVGRIVLKQAGGDPMDTPRQAQRFVDFYLTKRTAEGAVITKPDWSQAFSQWLRNSRPRQPGGGT